jgi:hypothetical protein
MGMFLIIAIIFVGAPIARAIARSIERAPGSAWTGFPKDDPEVKKALEAAEQRLSDSEARLAALEERVDFYEKLLRNPTSPSLPAPPSHQS